jgi:hypothetical protein
LHIQSDVFEHLCSWNNLLLAYRLAARGKRGQPNVAAFEHCLEDNLAALRCELLDRNYRPGPYRSFWVHEPKRRLISAAPFRDRVVHHALCNLIEPLFERSFVADTYANQRRKGTHRALGRVQQFARRYPFVVQADVRQFFPSLDHAILRGELARKITDLDTLWLVDRILESGNGVLADAYDMVFFPGDDLLAAARPRGLPIGNLTSQFWANVYMNQFDHFVKRELRCGGYVRYVDDLLLFGNDKRDLWHWLEALESRLSALRLTVHAGGHPRPVVEGIPFLGFMVFPERRRLKRRKGIHFRRRFARLMRERRQGLRTQSEVSSSLRGWINHVRYANTIGLRKALLREAWRSIEPPVLEGPQRSGAERTSVDAREALGHTCRAAERRG